MLFQNARSQGWCYPHPPRFCMNPACNEATWLQITQVPLWCWWRCSTGWELALVCMLWKVAVLTAAPRCRVFGMIEQETSYLDKKGDFIAENHACGKKTTSVLNFWRISHVTSKEFAGKTLNSVSHQMRQAELCCLSLEVLVLQHLVLPSWSKG